MLTVEPPIRDFCGDASGLIKRPLVLAGEGCACPPGSIAPGLLNFSLLSLLEKDSMDP